MGKTGIIYLVTNRIHYKRYVGQTIKKLEGRKALHIKAAFQNESNLKFHQALRKHGEDVFRWEILEDKVPYDKLDEREIYWVKQYDSMNEGYNMTLGGSTMLGFQHSEESKEKIRNSTKGKSNKDHMIARYGEEEGLKKYEEYINKLKERKGKSRLSLMIEKHGELEGTRLHNIMIEKIRAGHKGKKLSKEHKKKIGDGGRGKVLSEETKEKMRNKIVTQETRDKMSKFQKGKIVSEETREKLSNIWKGKHLSEDHKRKISEGLKKKHKEKGES